MISTILQYTWPSRLLAVLCCHVTLPIQSKVYTVQRRKRMPMCFFHIALHAKRDVEVLPRCLVVAAFSLLNSFNQLESG